MGAADRRDGALTRALTLTGADLAAALRAIAAGPHAANRITPAPGRATRHPSHAPEPPLTDRERRYLDHAEEEDVDRAFRGPPRDEGAGW